MGFIYLNLILLLFKYLKIFDFIEIFKEASFFIFRHRELLLYLFLLALSVSVIVGFGIPVAVFCIYLAVSENINFNSTLRMISILFI
jgi:hypothetical protein